MRKMCLNLSTAFVAVLFLVSSVAAGTLSFKSRTESQRNEFRGGTVLLKKYEKAPDGSLTETALEGAEFYVHQKQPDGTMEQWGKRFLTNKEGRIEFASLPLGDYVLRETHPPQGYDYDRDATGALREKYHFSVRQDATGTPQLFCEGVPANSILIYNRRLMGELRVQKKIAGFEALTEGQRTQSFTFLVRFGNNETYPYHLEGQETVQELGEHGSFSLRHGETAVFSGLPVGLSYELEELSAGEGWFSQSINTQVSIPENTVTAAFVNTAHEIPAPALFGRLHFTNRIVTATGEHLPEEALEQEFRFALFVDGVQQEAFSLKNGESITLSVPLGATYRIVETDYQDPTSIVFQNFLPQGNTHLIGQLFEDQVLTASFDHMYKKDQKIEIFGEKYWNLDSDPTVSIPKEIQLQLWTEEGLLAENLTVTQAMGWKYTFPQVYRFRADGQEERYHITETPIPSFSVSGGTADTNWNLINTYRKSVGYSDPPVRKRIRCIADAPSTKATFTFEMRALKGAPLPPGAVGDKKLMTLHGEEEKDFGDSRYTEPGTYSYEIRELHDAQSNEQGYLYDRTIYLLTVVIEETPTHSLVRTSKTIVNQSTGEEVADAMFFEFENTYDSGAVKKHETIPLTIRKEWDNKGAQHPDAITIQLRSGSIVVEGTLSADLFWSRTFEVPRWENGYECEYEIKEQPVAGYDSNITKEAEGRYLIRNVRKENQTTPINDSERTITDKIGEEQQDAKPSTVKADSPKTGDDGQGELWRAVMAVSGILLVLLLYINQQERKRGASSTSR